MEKIVIVAAGRTAMGSFQGSFASLSAPDLGAVVIEKVVEQANVPVVDIDEVIAAAAKDNSTIHSNAGVAEDVLAAKDTVSETAETETTEDNK